MQGTLCGFSDQISGRLGGAEEVDGWDGCSIPRPGAGAGLHLQELRHLGLKDSQIPHIQVCFLSLQFRAAEISAA